MSNLFPNQCRACGKRKKELKCIFETADEKSKIADQLMAICAGYDFPEIFECDMLPKGICSTCQLLLSNAYDFQQKCLRINTKFRNKLSKDLETVASNTETINPGYKCTKEHYTTVDGIDSIIDTKALTEINDCVYDYHFCKYCEFKSSIAENLKRHIVEYHSETDDINRLSEVKLKLKDKKTDVVTYINFDCRLCGKQFDNQSTLFKHLKKFHNKSEARKEQNYIYGLKRINRLYECNLCSKLFRRTNDLKVHSCVNNKQYECQLCNESFKEIHQYKEHIKEHENQKFKMFPGPPFTCKHCANEFSTETLFFEHLKICCDHTLIGTVLSYKSNFDCKKYQCDICSKFFKAKSVLADHIRTHTGDKPYECRICGRSFSQSASYKAHLTIHTGHKPHICNVCGKGFTVPANLRRHEVTHLGQFPFNCDQCTSAFKFKANLIDHIRKVHEKIRFECNECGGKYPSKHHLLKHMYVHIGNPYLCSLCDRTYREKRSLKVHFKNEHDINVKLSMIQKNIPVKVEQCITILNIEPVE